VRCIRCGGRYTTEGMGRRAAAYCGAAVVFMLRRIVSKMLGVTVDLSLSWLSMCYFVNVFLYGVEHFSFFSGV
jgi:hypothetical protein